MTGRSPGAVVPGKEQTIMSTSITPVGFKSGKDLTEEPGIAEEEQVTCVDCGATASDQSAIANGQRSMFRAVGIMPTVKERA